MSSAILLFHQGFTDFLNCLALIPYYASKYDTLQVLVKQDAYEFVDYFCNSLTNVDLIFLPQTFLDRTLIQKNTLLFSALGLDCSNSDILIHGYGDIHRKDKYVGVYENILTNTFFVDAFYLAYDINPKLRIDGFTFTRNMELENTVYANFIEIHGREYHLHHSVKPTAEMSIELAKCSDIFFDYIKVLEHAKSLTLLDSVWATLVYLLQAKYGLFSNIPITIVSRNLGYEKMFKSPARFSNWKFIGTSIDEHS